MMLLSLRRRRPIKGLDQNFQKEFGVDFVPNHSSLNKLIDVVSADKFDEKKAAEALRAYANCSSAPADYLLGEDYIQKLRTLHELYPRS